MPIKEIELVSFRNHAHYTQTFTPSVNVLWGPNGAGKTSILEGIHLLSIGRSFKTPRTRDLLRKGDPFFQVRGRFEDRGSDMEVQWNQMENGTKRILLNGKAVARTRDIVGKNPVVVLSPEEEIIVRGSPADRRKYFNRVFSVLSSSYLDTLSTYQRILRQRNAFLAGAGDRTEPGKSELDAWDHSLSRVGMSLWRERQIWLDKFAAELDRSRSRFFPEASLSCTSLPVPVNSPEAYQEQLISNRNRDLLLGRTTFGPHRDQIEFEWFGESLREFGSQGQQKLVLTLLKITEFELIRTETEKTPTFLLDDLFAKLDFDRSRRIVALLNSGIQTIITTTDLMDMEHHGLEIKPGEINTVKLG
ncbi:MAG: DNA replication and repair protein RecF [Candidatus Neomarinimicrobiota bacterium]|nr:MAG: DNA replication and repair protein RecF [Candidatus Neomarinimicrobiota bacterium]